MKKVAGKTRKPTRTTGKETVLLVATRKGGFFLRSDSGRRKWKLSKPLFLGQIVHHMVVDPRDRRSVIAAVRTGHLGPTVMRSSDGGKTWKEARRPPAFPKAPEGTTGRVVDHTFWLTPGHASQPHVWYGGTSPQGLFRSTDGCDTWEPVSGFNENPRYQTFMGGPQDGTPNGPKLHSILVDPRNADHLYCAMSSGGVHESTDGGKTWEPICDGLEVVEEVPTLDIQFHDPHCVRFCPSNPDRLYQQNHCGIYRIDRPATRWTRIGRAMPKTIGDVGFPMTVHPRNDEVAWVFPMDGSGVWPRTSPGGKPAAYTTRNGGKTWKRLDDGFPQSDAYWTVKRQAMTADAGDPVGLYLGTTSGEIWASRDEGSKWTCIARHLPEIYAIETA